MVDASTGLVSFNSNAGTCSIKIEQPGNASYRDAKAAYLRFSIEKRAQPLTWNTELPTTAVVGTPFTVDVTGGEASGKSVKLRSRSNRVCRVSGMTVTPKSAGTCKLQISLSGTSTYSSVREQKTVTVTD